MKEISRTIKTPVLYLTTKDNVSVYQSRNGDFNINSQVFLLAALPSWKGSLPRKIKLHLKPGKKWWFFGPSVSWLEQQGVSNRTFDAEMEIIER